jgi:hypothetical protein
MSLIYSPNSSFYHLKLIKSKSISSFLLLTFNLPIEMNRIIFILKIKIYLLKNKIYLKIINSSLIKIIKYGFNDLFFRIISNKSSINDEIKIAGS